MGWDDLRASAHRVIRRPAYSVCSVVLLGGAAATLTVVGRITEATLVEGLPYAPGHALVALRWSEPELGIPDMALSLVESLELPGRTSAFAGVSTTLTPISVTLLGADGPVHLTAGLVTPESFEVLGLEPALGRRFNAEEGEPGAPAGAVILDHGTWQRSFGGRADVLGEELVINDLRWTVVGVLPRGLTPAPEQSEQIDVWLPMGVAELVLGQDVFSRPAAHMFRVNALLSPNVTSAALARELPRVASGFASDYPDTDAGWELHAESLQDRVLGRTRAPVVALLLGTLGIAFAAALSLVGLLTQRTEDAWHEVAVRSALGATEQRLEWQRVGDALVLGGLGGALGVALAHLSFAALRHWNPLELPRYMELGLRWPESAAAVTLSLALALGATLLVRPRSASCDALLRGTSASGAGERSKRGLVSLGLEVAMSAALTVLAIASARSLQHLRSMDTGMSSDGLITARLEVPTELMPTEVIALRADVLLESVGRLPDVASAFVWSPEIPSEARTYTALQLEAMAVGGNEDRVLARYHSVSPGAASLVGLRLIAGRDLLQDDVTTGRRTALVSASAAVKWWGSEAAALGQRLRRPSHDGWSEVVGVVADAPISGRYGPGSDNDLDVFFIFQQDPRRTLILFARAAGSTIDLGRLRGAVASVMPELPLYDVRWLAERLRDQERIHLSTAGFTLLYAVTALVLTLVGLVGSSLLCVGRRRVEMGIRQAMGATPGAALRELLGGGFVAVAAGVVTGALLARMGLAWVDPEVLTVGPGDLPSHVGMALTVGGLGTLALLVPALSSLRLAPMECLRQAYRS